MLFTHRSSLGLLPLQATAQPTHSASPSNTQHPPSTFVGSPQHHDGMAYCRTSFSPWLDLHLVGARRALHPLLATHHGLLQILREHLAPPPNNQASTSHAKNPISGEPRHYRATSRSPSPCRTLSSPCYVNHFPWVSLYLSSPLFSIFVNICVGSD